MVNGVRVYRCFSACDLIIRSDCKQFQKMFILKAKYCPFKVTYIISWIIITTLPKNLMNTYNELCKYVCDLSIRSDCKQFQKMFILKAKYCPFKVTYIVSHILVANAVVYLEVLQPWKMVWTSEVWSPLE